MDHSVKTFAIQALRRASLKWKPRNDAVKAARIGYGLYICNFCKQQTRAKNKVLDHVIPVVDPITGFQSLDEYAVRLLVQQGGWQVLCNICHDRKSAQEGVVRTHFRKKKTRVKSTKKTKSS